MPKLNADLLNRSRCMGTGALGVSIKEFTCYLATLGHTPLTISSYEDGARHFADWLRRAGIALSAVDDGIIVRFAGHRCRCAGNRRNRHLSAKYVRRVRRFVRFLAERSVVTVTPPGCLGGGQRSRCRVSVLVA
jgi:integrase/recombinase XerD